MNEIHFSDFYKVPDIKFDIKKLRAELDIVLKKKKFNTLGISHFAAISLNKVPGDENSIKGHNKEELTGPIPMKEEKKLKETKQ